MRAARYAEIRHTKDIENVGDRNYHVTHFTEAEEKRGI